MKNRPTPLTHEPFATALENVLAFVRLLRVYRTFAPNFRAWLPLSQATSSTKFHVGNLRLLENVTGSYMSRKRNVAERLDHLPTVASSMSVHPNRKVFTKFDRRTAS